VSFAKVALAVCVGVLLAVAIIGAVRAGSGREAPYVPPPDAAELDDYAERCMRDASAC
jgi:hypothetical protein